MAPQPLVFCTFCGRTGRAVTRWRGSKQVARFLWLTLLLPGPIYNYWQWKGRKQVCAYCGSEYIEPAEEQHRDTSFSYEEMARMAKEEPFLAKPGAPSPAPSKPDAPPKPRTPRSDPDQF